MCGSRIVQFISNLIVERNAQVFIYFRHFMYAGVYLFGTHRIRQANSTGTDPELGAEFDRLRINLIL